MCVLWVGGVWIGLWCVFSCCAAIEAAISKLKNWIEAALFYGICPDDGIAFCFWEMMKGI